MARERCGWCNVKALLALDFMYHPSWGEDACPSCSFWADNFNGIPVHLNARDVNLVAVSKARIEQIEAYKKRMSGSFESVSSYENDFNRDYGVGFRAEEIERAERVAIDPSEVDDLPQNTVSRELK